MFWSSLLRRPDFPPRSWGVDVTVDGHYEAASVAKLFADKYPNLFISVTYDVNKMQHIQDEVNCLQMNRRLLIVFSTFMS